MAIIQLIKIIWITRHYFLHKLHKQNLTRVKIMFTERSNSK